LARLLNSNGIHVDASTAATVKASLSRLGKIHSPANESSPEASPRRHQIRQRPVPEQLRGETPTPHIAECVALPRMTLPDSISGLRSWIEARRISVRESLDLQASRIKEADALIHSVSRHLSWRLPSDEKSTLAGVGLAHKDNIACGDLPPGNGLPTPVGVARIPCPPTAAIVSSLNAHGATSLATLVMAERACGATSENHHFPPVVNPLDPTLFVGGSSSGSAAAVAAGFCYGATGTDTAGSVRIPAASCGVLGFKPSRGILADQGVVPLAPSLDTVGLLARSAADLCLLYQAATTSGRRATTLGQPLSAVPAQTSWRLGNCLPLGHMDTSVADTLERFISMVAQGGAAPHSQQLALPKEVNAFGETLFYYEAARQHEADLRDAATSMNTVARQLCTQGMVIPDTWYANALQKRRALQHAFIEQHLSTSDLLLLPAFTISVPERRHVTFSDPDFDTAKLLQVFRWMMPANYLDLPALVIPVGNDRSGRPVSVQLIGRPGSEQQLLAFALWVENLSGNPLGLFGLGAPHMQTIYQ